MKQLLKIADSYRILLSSQHSYLMSLYDALVSSLEKNEYRVIIADIFDQLIDQINAYYETAGILMQITLHDDYLDVLQSRKNTIDTLNGIRGKIFSRERSDIREKIYSVQKGLAMHHQKMQKLLDSISNKKVLDDLQLPEEDKLGIEVIDYQHGKIMELVLKMIDSVKVSYDKDIVNDMFYELIQKYKQHFAFEEYYFKRYKYQYIDEHIKEHNIFIKNMIINKNKLYSGMFDIDPLKLFETMKQEVIDHIEVLDKKYMNFIKNRMVDSR